VGFARQLVLQKSGTAREKLGISNRMLEVLVAEVILQRTSIHTLVDPVALPS